MGLASYLQELSSLPLETPLEPELKDKRLEQDQKIREDQDLRAGAVMTATVEEGEGDESPGTGDLVYVHVTVRTEEEEVLYSTRGQDGGNGQAMAFMIEAGQRAPRAWEIVLKGMRLKQISGLKVKPSYGYEHPNCSMPAHEGVPTNETLCFELQPVQWYPAGQVKALPLSDNTYRRVTREGTGWENPRAPFEVTFHCKACCPAYDGIQMTGFRYFETETEAPLTAQMGSGQLPPGLEMALSAMTQGEQCVFVMPAERMRPGSDTAAGGSRTEACLLPQPPGTALQVELELELLHLVQVRDMIGDGSIVKRRLRLGTGEFPVDCPIEDTTVRIHYRARPLRLAEGQSVQSASSANASGTSKATSNVWLCDSRQGRAGGGGDSGGSTGAGAEAAGPLPVEFDTGCGEMPDGLEQAVKLMVCGELSSVACQPNHAYAGREDAPVGIVADDAVEFEVELVSFEREGHWQTLSMEERFPLAEKLKAKGNALFRAKKFEFARVRYERLQRMLDSTRDYVNQDEVERMDAFKLAVLSNLVLCCFHQTDYAQSAAYASKALEHDPGSTKLRLRRARALSMKGNYDQAEEDLLACQGPDAEAALAQEVKQELVANKRRAKAAEIKQRQTFRSFFDR